MPSIVSLGTDHTAQGINFAPCAFPVVTEAIEPYFFSVKGAWLGLGRTALTNMIASWPERGGRGYDEVGRDTRLAQC
jgi:hypothetical protein